MFDRQTSTKLYNTFYMNEIQFTKERVGGNWPEMRLETINACNSLVTIDVTNNDFAGGFGIQPALPEGTCILYRMLTSMS